jgi:hypothetical protein
MQYNFPKQETVVQFVVDAIQAEAFNTRTLFLIGTYNIGLIPSTAMVYAGLERPVLF